MCKKQAYSRYHSIIDSFISDVTQLFLLIRVNYRVHFTAAKTHAVRLFGTLMYTRSTGVLVAFVGRKVLHLFVYFMWHM